MNFRLVFLGLLVLSAANAEFLFEKNVAADDKFMCLHKMLYRNEKPIIKTNPARILSLKRNLQVDLSNTDLINLKNHLCEDGRLTFPYRATLCQSVAVKLSLSDPSIGSPVFYRSDEYKGFVVSAVNNVYKSEQMLGSNVTSYDYLESEPFLTKVVAAVSNQITVMMGRLGPIRILQAKQAGISTERLTYVMLNINYMFHRDSAVAREAYDNYFSANKDQLASATFNSEATVRWIEAIKKRFNSVIAEQDPDTEKILEPFYETGSSEVETPSGAYVEPIPKSQTPTPKLFEEVEPATPVAKRANEDMIIKDMLIEIQRTYNVEKMLLTYNQLTSSMKNDIQACGLSLKGAIQRCEKLHGAGRCETISATMAAPKCRDGWIRQGCCSCIPGCPDADFYTKNNAFCEMKTSFYTNPTGLTNDGAKNTASGCPPGFELNKILCYRSCPSGTTRIGSTTCFKTSAEYLGAPFVWTAGDE